MTVCTAESVYPSLLPIVHTHAGHSRGGSRDLSNSGWVTYGYDDPLRLVKYAGVKAHQQPITVMTGDHTRLVTGSHDHTLKVSSL